MVLGLFIDLFLLFTFFSQTITLIEKSDLDHKRNERILLQEYRIRYCAGITITRLNLLDATRSLVEYDPANQKILDQVYEKLDMQSWLNSADDDLSAYPERQWKALCSELGEEIGHFIKIENQQSLHPFNYIYKHIHAEERNN